MRIFVGNFRSFARGVLSAILFGSTVSGSALAMPLAHQSENQIPVTMVSVDQSSAYTEVRLRADAALASVCWYFSGPNSPYLLANNQRYLFLGGDNIVACNGAKPYASGEVMTLRFQLLPTDVAEFSLVEGKGGEDQALGGGFKEERFWNFLHVRLK
jgi:hypothetical protein